MPKIPLVPFGNVIPTGYKRRRTTLYPETVPRAAVLPTAPPAPATPSRVQQAYRRLFGPFNGDLLSQVLDWKNIGRVVQIAGRDLTYIRGLTGEMKAKQESLEKIEISLNENNNRMKYIYAQIAEKEEQGRDQADIGALRREIPGLYDERDQLSVDMVQLHNEINELRKRLEDIPFYSIPRSMMRNITDSLPFSRGNFSQSIK